MRAPSLVPSAGWLDRYQAGSPSATVSPASPSKVSRYACFVPPGCGRLVGDLALEPQACRCAGARAREAGDGARDGREVERERAVDARDERGLVLVPDGGRVNVDVCRWAIPTKLTSPCAGVACLRPKMEVGTLAMSGISSYGP